MQWWLIAVISLCVLLVAIVISFVLDAYRRHKFEMKHPAITMVPLDVSPDNWARNNTLIVYLPGILASADMIPPRILSVWAKYGEVWGVNYALPRFLPILSAYEVASAIKKLFDKDDAMQNVVLIGSSMGALLANDVLQILSRKEGFNADDVKLVLIDAPTERQDLHRPLDLTAPLVRWLPFGPIWSHLSRPIMKLLFIPPKEGEIDADVDRDWLAQQVDGARSFPLSFWRDQIMYILDHGALEPDSIGSRLVYIRSSEDNDTVRPEAVLKWINASDDSMKRTQCLAEGAKHAAFAQNPAAYEEAFPEAFEFLGL